MPTTLLAKYMFIPFVVRSLCCRVAPSLDTLAHIIGPNQNECYDLILKLKYSHCDLPHILGIDSFWTTEPKGGRDAGTTGRVYVCRVGRWLGGSWLAG